MICFVGVFLVGPKVFLIILGTTSKRLGLGQFVNFNRREGLIIYNLGKFSIFYVYIYIYTLRN